MVSREGSKQERAKESEGERERGSEVPNASVRHAHG
jgi:hypothetical protein